MCLEKTYELITDVYGRHVLLEYALNCDSEEEKQALFASILKWVNFDEEAVAAETPQEPARKYHPLERQPAPPVVKEDLMCNYQSHRIIKVLVKKDSAGSFPKLLLELIKPKIVDYAQHVYAGWVVFALLRHTETGSKVTELLKQHEFILDDESKDSALEKIVSKLHNKT